MKAVVVLFKEEDLQKIKEAAQKVALKTSPFIKSCAVKEASQILLKNQEVSSNG